MKCIFTVFLFLTAAKLLLAQGSSLVWSEHLYKISEVPTIYSDGKIFCSSTSGTINCLDNSGNIIWQVETNGMIDTFPVLENNLLIAATYEGDLLIIDAKSGDLILSIGIGGNITSGIATIDVTQNGKDLKAVVAGTADGNFYCYDLENLEQVWMNQSSKSKINSSVVVSNNKVFFQNKEGILYCVSSNNGLLIWKWKPNVKNTNPLFKSDLFLQDDNLYLVDQDGNLHCINVLQGTEKWNIKKINAAGIIRTNSKGELILSTTKNEIIVVSPKSGKVIEKITLLNNDVTVTDILVTNKLIIAALNNGSVYQIKTKSDIQMIFQYASPIVSLTNVNGKCLITDYDGNLTLLKLSE